MYKVQTNFDLTDKSDETIIHIFRRTGGALSVEDVNSFFSSVEALKEYMEEKSTDLLFFQDKILEEEGFVYGMALRGHVGDFKTVVSPEGYTIYSECLNFADFSEIREYKGVELPGIVILGVYHA